MKNEKQGGKVERTDTSYILFASLTFDVWPDSLLSESNLQLASPAIPLSYNF